MTHEETITDLTNKLTVAIEKIENLRLQQGRLESHVESERGTTSRESKRLQEEIDKVNNVIFDRKEGLAFEIDRLIQKEKKRDEKDKQIWWLWGSVALLTIKIIFDLLTKK